MTINKFLKFASDFILYTSLTIAGFFVVNQFLGVNAFRFYVVTSGSMEPTIPTGSVIMVGKRAEYFTNDILTFSSGPKTTTTHRVLAKTWPDGIFKSPSFVTKGDANDSLDTNQLASDKIVGKVLLTVPYVGRITSIAKTPMGFIFLVVVPGTIIVYEELRSLVNNLRKLPRPKFSPRVAIAVPIACALFVAIGLTGAYFSDLEVSPHNSLAVSTPEVTPTPTLSP